MFLKRLELENVRSIERFDMSFLDAEEEVRQWTFLLGQNGTGKSTVLRATALLLAGSEAMAELLGDADSWIRNGASEARIAAELTTADGKHRAIELTLHRGDSIRVVFDRNRDTLDDLDRALEHSRRNYLTLGYGVSRRPSDDNGKMASEASFHRQPRARSVATLFSPEALLNPLKNWAMDLHYRHGDDALVTIRQALAGLLPDVEFDHIDKDRRQLVFRTLDGEVVYERLSDGYQNVVAWLGDLLYRITEIFQDYKKPLEARGLLLIDEIDLHLHPVWQRHLVQYLSGKLPNFQIFCTTHSPLTVHQAGEGELFFLDRDPSTHSPILNHYEGTPNKLLLHQLLTSPIFGFETPDSLPVEDLKQEYRSLRDQSTRTTTEEKRFEAIKGELAELPKWNRGSEEEKRIEQLLVEISQNLKAGA